jgi:hypothetical protein
VAVATTLVREARSKSVEGWTAPCPPGLGVAYLTSKSPPSRKGREKDGAPGEAAMFLTGFQRITALYGRRSYRSRATLFDKTKGVGNGHGWAATLTSSNKKVLRIAQAEQNNTAAIWGKASSGAHAHRFEVDNPNILPEGSEPVCSKMHSFRTSPLPAGGWTPLKLALRLSGRFVRRALALLRGLSICYPPVPSSWRP